MELNRIDRMNTTLTSTSHLASKPATNAGDALSPAATDGTPSANQQGRLNSLLQDLNHRLASTSTKVVVAPNKPVDDVWLNVVDTSGRVLQEIPPESVRKLLDSNRPVGLAFDKFY